MTHPRSHGELVAELEGDPGLQSPISLHQAGKQDSSKLILRSFSTHCISYSLVRINQHLNEQHEVAVEGVSSQ